jgi:hypothetical protein
VLAWEPRKKIAGTTKRSLRGAQVTNSTSQYVHYRTFG